MAPSRITLLILLLATTVAHADDSLGRLFLTVEQRLELDAQRDPNAPHAAAGLAGVGTATERTVVVNGIVRRSGGTDVVWINGARTSAASEQSVQLQRGPDRSNRVTLKSADGSVVRLKPGQYWDPATGRVADCLGCIPAPAPAAKPLAEPPTTTPPESPAESPADRPPAPTPAPAPATTPVTVPKSEVTPRAVASAASLP